MQAPRRKARAKAIAVTRRIEWALMMVLSSLAFLLLHSASH